MPLHLLGKKSWNVYNKDNIDRVRRDEAEARVREQEAERKTRDDDAAERLRLLRGGSPHAKESAHEAHKRKRTYEDRPSQAHRDEKRPRHSETRDDTKAVSRKTSRETEQPSVTHDSLDQISNMRFRDAAGRQPDSQRPWYSTAASQNDAPEPGRDVWGNEDAGRRARNQKRLDANDPLSAIKKGVKQLKDVEKQKSEWRKEREKDLYEVEDLARRERHRRRREERHKHRSEKQRSHRSSHSHSHDRRQDHDRDRDKPEHQRSGRT